MEFLWHLWNKCCDEWDGEYRLGDLKWQWGARVLRSSWLSIPMHALSKRRRWQGQGKRGVCWEANLKWHQNVFLHVSQDVIQAAHENWLDTSLTSCSFSSYFDFQLHCWNILPPSHKWAALGPDEFPYLTCKSWFTSFWVCWHCISLKIYTCITLFFRNKLRNFNMKRKLNLVVKWESSDSICSA